MTKTEYNTAPSSASYHCERMSHFYSSAPQDPEWFYGRLSSLSMTSCFQVFGCESCRMNAWVQPLTDDISTAYCSCGIHYYQTVKQQISVCLCVIYVSRGLFIRSTSHTTHSIVIHFALKMNTALCNSEGVVSVILLYGHADSSLAHTWYPARMISWGSRRKQNGE